MSDDNRGDLVQLLSDARDALGGIGLPPGSTPVEGLLERTQKACQMAQDRAATAEKERDRLVLMLQAKDRRIQDLVSSLNIETVRARTLLEVIQVQAEAS